jgi:hypothetical protein
MENKEDIDSELLNLFIIETKRDRGVSGSEKFN